MTRNTKRYYPSQGNGWTQSNRREATGKTRLLPACPDLGTGSLLRGMLRTRVPTDRIDRRGLSRQAESNAAVYIVRVRQSLCGHAAFSHLTAVTSKTFSENCILCKPK